MRLRTRLYLFLISTDTSRTSEMGQASGCLWVREALPCLQEWDSRSGRGCRPKKCDEWNDAARSAFLQTKCWASGQQRAERQSPVLETHLSPLNHDSCTTLTSFSTDARSHQRNLRWVKVNDSPTTALLGYNESKSQAKFYDTDDHLLHKCLLASRHRTGQTIYSVKFNEVPEICPCRSW